MEQHEEKFVEKFIFLRPRTNSSSIKKWNIFNDFNTQKYLFFFVLDLQSILFEYQSRAAEAFVE